MTCQYVKYLTHLTNWTNNYLNLQFSAQIGFNLPSDVLENIPLVNAPETETLAFSNNIDAFRQYSGAANLAGKRVISLEVGADIMESYSQTLPQLLQECKQAFGGANQVVIHGATYSHDYINTTWPGFTTFNYLFSTIHSRHQQAWDVGYTETINYLSRVQWVLQKGVPKSDIAFWDKQKAQAWQPQTLYLDPDLSTAGYTYEYLSLFKFQSS